VTCSHSYLSHTHTHAHAHEHAHAHAHAHTHTQATTLQQPAERNENLHCWTGNYQSNYSKNSSKLWRWFFMITEWHGGAMIELWSKGHEFNSWAGHGCVTTLGKLFVSLSPRAYLGTSKSWDANSQTGTPTRQQHHSSFESHHRWLYMIRDAISGEKVYNR